MPPIWPSARRRLELLEPLCSCVFLRSRELALDRI
jgi:hypothetical protein